MRKTVLFSLVLAVFAAGCGDGNNAGVDIHIVLPDNGFSDKGITGDVSVIDDNGQVERDTTESDVDVVTDAVSTDETVNTDNGEDTATVDAGNDVEDVYVPQCWLGQDQCQPLETTDKKTCETAQIIGRVAFLGGKTYTRLSPDTINENTGGNDDDDNISTSGCPFLGSGDDLWCQSECSDDGKDHFYKVYLMAGDLFSLSITDRLVYEHEDYGYHIDFMLKVYKGDTCPLDREDLMTCVNASDGNKPTVNNVQIKPMTAEEEGWYTIVVDSTDMDEAGTYTISANLFHNSEYEGDWSLCCDFPSP